MAEPAVRNTALYHGADVIAVGSPAWFSWLAQAERFRYEGPTGTFGARRERMQRGGWYWKAYRRVAGRLRRAYLGRSEDLTIERLARAAAALTGEAGLEAVPVTSAPAILHTRLEPPPPRAGFVNRAELDIQLNTALQHRLTVVIAPAGWGKTTLLASWATSPALQNVAQVAWLGLDPADNDPTRLWSYSCAALSQYEPGVLAVETLFRATSLASSEQLMTGLINTIAGTRGRSYLPIVLILDDLHVLTNPEILASITFLIDHMPQRLHLVLAGRAEPPLPLARWRAAGWVAELRAAELRFGLADSAALIKGVIGRPLPEEAIAALVERTEGWAAGLQLAGLALRAANSWSPELLSQFSGSHPYILDYLLDEILRNQPPDVQQFLLWTSVLERLSPELCDAVLGSEHSSPSADILEYLERANLFLVALDQQRHWFRYHQLFADALRAQLMRQYPGLASTLQRRAMEWYAERTTSGAHEHIVPAVEYALAAGAFQQAADLIAQNTDTMLWSRGEVRTLQRWITMLPEAIRHCSPAVLLAESWSLLAIIHFDRLEACLDTLDALLDRSDQPQLLGELLAIRSYQKRINGEFDAALTLGLQALELIPSEQQLVRHLVGVNLDSVYLMLGDIHAARQLLEHLQEGAWRLQNYPIIVTLAGTHLMEATLLMFEGRVYEAEHIIQQVLENSLRPHHGRAIPTGMIQVALGEIRYEHGDLEAAERHTQLAISQGAEWWNSDILHAAHYLIGRIRRANGDIAGAHAAYAHAREMILAYNVPYITAGVRVSDAWQAYEDRDWNTAEQILAERQLSINGSFDPSRYDEYELLARLKRARGQHTTAITLAERLRDIAAAHGHILRVIANERILAQAYHANGQREQAFAALKRALLLAEPGGLIRSFVDEGQPMRELLVEALHSDSSLTGQHKLYIERLLAAFTQPQKPAQSAAQAGEQLVERLTEREHEILRLVTSGASNRLIAEQLVVSLHTVKKHLTHIFAKLDAPNRTAAVARAREYGLV